MTGSTPTTPNSLQAADSPLTYGAANYGAVNYFAVLRSQLEMTAQLTIAWASAMSALSGRMLALLPAVADPTRGAGDQAAHSRQSNGFPGSSSLPDGAAESVATEEPPSGGSSAGGPALERPAGGGMLSWLTEPPTLQTNLFDETIELLVDEDIKTAS